MSDMKNKALIWTVAISVIAIAGYVTYSLVKKKQEDPQKLKIGSQDIVNAGTFIASLFKKKAPVTGTDGTGTDPYGLNYNTGLPPDYVAPDYVIQ
jgi:hypothetical protein